MKKLISTLTFLSFFHVLAAQDFEIPEDFKLKTPEDYTEYQDVMVKCVDWLVETPPNEQLSRRREANRFVLAWLTGSPTVTIEVNPNIVTFLGSDNTESLLVFMGGWAKYALENQDYKNKTAGNLAGIELLVTFYQKYRGVGLLAKDKNIEKYVKMKEKGKLIKFIQQNT